MNHSKASTSSVAVLVLAAGLSRRMGEENKLHLPVDGQPMLRHALQAATNCGAESVYLLTGFERDRSLAVAEPFEFSEIYNPDFREGKGKSLAVGLSALQSLNFSVLVLLADQPTVSSELLRVLVRAHINDGARRALVPVYEGKWGTPRILPAELVGLTAEGGSGFSLRETLSSGAFKCQLLAVDDPAVLLDVDTPAEYLRLMQQSKSG